MRFRVGGIPDVIDFEPEREGWHALREPSPWVAQLIALPIGMVVGFALLVTWPLVSDDGVTGTPSLWFLVALMVGLIPAHELIHVALHPGMGTSTSTLVGFWPQKIIFYAHYEEGLSRNRFAAILVAPFLVISIVPLLVCAALGIAPVSLAVVSVVNGLVSCVDMLGVVLILAQVPAAATVRNKGYRSWWTVPA